MFETWNILDAGLHKESTGHHYWETKAITDELLARGSSVRIFSSRGAPVERFPAAVVYPTFAADLYETLSHRSRIEDFLRHNHSFNKSLSQLDRSLFAGPLTYFPTISERQLHGAIRWLAAFKDAERPKTVVTLLPPTEWSKLSYPVCMYRMTWACCPEAVRNKLALTVRTSVAADQFRAVLGMKTHVLPSPLGAHERRKQIAEKIPLSSSGPMLVSFVAGARAERGSALVPEIVKLCLQSDTRFFIQIKSEDDKKLPFLNALSGFPNVELHEGILGRDDYYNVIARSVVLLPYAPNFYKWKASGVYMEAKFMGAPVIVPANSWMAGEVRAFGNGLVFAENTPEAIAACIARAQSEIETLRERAAVLAQRFAIENGPDRCIDAIESLFASR